MESETSAPELLSEQEAAVYDRQIRVWGVDTQRKLTKGRVLVVGMSNTIAELCKNIVLAGVGSVTLFDDPSSATNVDSANFLIPAEQQASEDVAKVCMESLKDFNPMVHVSLEKGSLSEKPAEFLDNFDVVVVGRSSLCYRMLVNSLCRKTQHKVSFFAVDCRGPFGEIFVDLQSHSYSLKAKENETESVKTLNYCSLEEAIAAKWDKLPRRATKLFFALRILENFEKTNSRRPGQVTFDDLSGLLETRKSVCESQGVSETLVPEKLLNKLLYAGGKEHPPVCAIIGGILGQELLKALSGKGEPVKNFFLFDPSDGKGIIEDIPRSQ